MSRPLLQRLAAKLPRNRIVRSVLALTSGTALAQLITIGVMPIVTRLYTPTEIGIISLFQSFFIFWSATLSLRYSHALLVARDDTESQLVFRLAMGITILMSLLGLPVLWLLDHFRLFGFELLPNWAVLVAGPVLLGQGIFMVYRAWALRAGLVPAIARASVIRAAANGGTRVGLGLMGTGVVGLFAAEFAGACVSMLGLARATHRHFASSKPARIPLHDLRQVARRYAKFPLLEAPSAWIDALAMALPLPMVVMLYGPAEAGWFGLARLIVSAPNAQIGTAVADVFQMELAKAVLERNLTHARRVFYQFMRKMALLGLAPLLTILLTAPWIVPWVFGKHWTQTGLAAAAIAPWLYVSLIVSPLSRLLSVLQKQEFKLLYDLSAVSLLAGVYFVTKLHDLSFLQFLITLTIANIIAHIIYAAVLIGVMERKLAQ